MEQMEVFASRVSVLEAHVESIEAALTSNQGAIGRIFEERERLSLVRMAGITDHLDAIDKELEHRRANIGHISVLTTKIEGLDARLDDQITATKNNVALALSAAEKSTMIAQATADTAVKKAEGAAEKEYLESKIQGLRDSFDSQLLGQKEAMVAALVATKDALTAAMGASDKAIQKAEVATEARFSSVNEFRSSLNDMATRLIPRLEAEQRFAAMADAINKLDIFKASQQAVATKGENDTRMNLALVGVVLSTLIAMASLAFNIFKSTGHG